MHVMVIGVTVIVMSACAVAAAAAVTAAMGVSSFGAVPPVHPKQKYTRLTDKEAKGFSFDSHW